jgi:hypothetical protein
MSVSIGVSDIAADPTGKTFTIVVQYAGKECQITLSAAEPLFDREPRQDQHHRALLELIDALTEWERSPRQISWHAKDRKT